MADKCSRIPRPDYNTPDQIWPGLRAGAKPYAVARTHRLEALTKPTISAAGANPFVVCTQWLCLGEAILLADQA
jgi:hypothetical protein